MIGTDPIAAIVVTDIRPHVDSTVIGRDHSNMASLVESVIRFDWTELAPRRFGSAS